MCITLGHIYQKNVGLNLINTSAEVKSPMSGLSDYRIITYWIFQFFSQMLPPLMWFHCFPLLEDVICEKLWKHDVHGDPWLFSDYSHVFLKTYIILRFRDELFFCESMKFVSVCHSRLQVTSCFHLFFIVGGVVCTFVAIAQLKNVMPKIFRNALNFLYMEGIFLLRGGGCSTLCYTE